MGASTTRGPEGLLLEGKKERRTSFRESRRSMNREGTPMAVAGKNGRQGKVLSMFSQACTHLHNEGNVAFCAGVEAKTNRIRNPRRGV